MTGKLLTTEQAADYLGLSPLTLASWRNTVQGPKYILLGTDDIPGRSGKKAIRYGTDDLDSFIDSRRIDPAAREPPPTRRIEPRPLTDAEWLAIHDAVRTFDRKRYRTGFLLGHKHRAVLNALLAACDAGKWDNPSDQHMLRMSLQGEKWLLTAFKALESFDDFPYVLVTQYSVIRRNRRRDLPTRVVNIRTDTLGPKHGRKRQNVNAVVTHP